MYGFESPVVVQNITESDAAAMNDGQPSNVPGLSDLLNLGSGTHRGQFEKSSTSAR